MLKFPGSLAREELIWIAWFVALCLRQYRQIEDVPLVELEDVPLVELEDVPLVELEDVSLVEFMYFVLLACQVRVTVCDSSLCCCIPYLLSALSSLCLFTVVIQSFCNANFVRTSSGVLFPDSEELKYEHQREGIVPQRVFFYVNRHNCWRCTDSRLSQCGKTTARLSLRPVSDARNQSLRHRPGT